MSIVKGFLVKKSNDAGYVPVEEKYSEDGNHALVKFSLAVNEGHSYRDKDTGENKTRQNTAPVYFDCVIFGDDDKRKRLTAIVENTKGPVYVDGQLYYDLYKRAEGTQVRNLSIRVWDVYDRNPIAQQGNE